MLLPMAMTEDEAVKRAPVSDLDDAFPRRRVPPRALWLGLLFVGATLLMYRPTPSGIGRDFFGNVGDPSFTSWVLLWDGHALLHSPLHLFDANIFWPHNLTLAYSENLLPLLPPFALLRWLTGNVVLSMNLVILGLSVFNQTTTYLLAKRLVGRTGPAVFAALAYGFSGFVFMHTGHVQLLTLGTFPLCFLLLLRLFDKPTPGRAIALALASTCLFTAALYYGAVFLVCAAVLVVGQLVTTRFADARRLLVQLTITAVISGVLLVPIVKPYQDVQPQLPPRTTAEQILYALNPPDLVSPAPNTLLYGGLADAAAKRDSPAEHAYFPGFITMGLALVGAGALLVTVWRRRGRPLADDDAERRRLVELLLLGCVAVAALVLSLGPEIHGVTAPFRFFADHVPGFSGIRVTSRLVVPALLYAALLAAFGLDRITRRLEGVPLAAAVGLCCVVVLAELAVSPVPSQRFEDGSDVTAVYHALADKPAGAVAELPIIDMTTVGGAPWADVEGPRMIYAAADWHPRVNGYSGYWPNDYVPVLRDLNTFPSAPAVARAKALGVRYVILHIGPSHGYQQLTEQQAQAEVDALPPTATATRYGSAWLVDLGG